jgi:Phosphoesterase family
LLQAAGITSKVYGTPDAHLGDHVLRYFPQYRPVGGNSTLAANAFGSNAFPADFAADAAAGRLPQVSWVLGSLVDTEHAPAPVEWGQDDVQKVVLAPLNSPQWPSTALVITYDENGGFFDHVPPPVPSSTDAAQRAGEFFNVSRLAPTAKTEGAGFLSNPIGLGFAGARSGDLAVLPQPRPGNGPDGLQRHLRPHFATALCRGCVQRARAATQRWQQHPWTQPLASGHDRRHVERLQFRGRTRHLSTESADRQPCRSSACAGECPAPTGTLVGPSFSAGYPVPATAIMPVQGAVTSSGQATERAE